MGEPFDFIVPISLSPGGHMAMAALRDEGVGTGEVVIFSVDHLIHPSIQRERER
jgi:hypothetical protein